MSDLTQAFEAMMLQQMRPAIEKVTLELMQRMESQMAEILKPETKGVWYLEDVASFLNRSPSYITDCLLPTAHMNGFPIPRRTTTMKGGVERSSVPMWMPVEVQAWVKSLPKDSTVMVKRARGKTTK